MTRFFSRHSLKVLVVVVFLLPLLVMGLRHLHMSNAVETWLPRHSPEAISFEWYQEHFGREEFVLASWVGSSLDDPRVEFFARRVEELPEVETCKTPSRLVESMTRLGVPRDEAIKRLKGVLSGPEGSPVGVAIVLSEKGTEDRDATVKRIRDEAKRAGVREDHLRLGGPPVANVALDKWSRPSLRRLLPIATVVCVSLTFLCLRSLRLGLQVLATAYFGVLSAMAVVAFTGGSLNLLMIIMPTLVLVVGLSGSIHMAHYWRYAAAEGLSGATGRAWKMAWMPCVFASVTTAIGLASLATSDILPVRQFGMYAAVGTLVTLALILVTLPAGLQLWPGRPGSIRPASSQWLPYAGWITRHSGPVTLACLGLFALAAVGLSRMKTETKAIRYFPPESRIVQDYHWLETNLGGLVPLETIVCFDKNDMGFMQRLQLVHRIEQDIRALPDIAGVLSLADFAPPQLQQAGLSAALLEGTAENLTRTRKDARTLMVETEDGQQLWRITARTNLMRDVDYNALLARLEQIVTDRVREDAQGAPGIYARFTGLVPLLIRTQQEVLRGLMVSFVLAFAVIGFVIIVLLRSPMAGVVAMIPNLTPVVAVFGVLGWAGVALDIGTMMTASVALGIAVDGTLHLLTWFGRGIREGRTRRAAVVLALKQCGPAIVQTSAVAGLGLGVLAASPFLPTSRFGWLMAGLLGAAVLGGIILLPALLAGPVGVVLERTYRKKSLVPAPKSIRRRTSEPVKL